LKRLEGGIESSRFVIFVRSLIRCPPWRRLGSGGGSLIAIRRCALRIPWFVGRAQPRNRSNALQFEAFREPAGLLKPRPNFKNALMAASKAMQSGWPSVSLAEECPAKAGMLLRKLVQDGDQSVCESAAIDVDGCHSGNPSTQWRIELNPVVCRQLLAATARQKRNL